MEKYKDVRKSIQKQAYNEYFLPNLETKTEWIILSINFCKKMNIQKKLKTIVKS